MWLYLAGAGGLWHLCHMGLMNDLYLSRKPLAAFAVIGLSWACYFAQMPVIKATLGVSDAAYGMIVLVSALGAVAAMVLAPMAARFAGPYALMVGSLGVCFGFLWTGSALSPVTFMIAMGLAAAGSGILDVLANARISGIEAKHQRPLMNLNHAFYSFCYAGGALLTGAAREAGWSPFEVFSALAIAIILLCLVMYGPDTNNIEDEEKGAPRNLPTGLIWIAGLVVCMAFLAEAATEGWSALHIERSLGGGAGEGALGPAVLGLMMGIGRLSGYAASKYISDLLLMGLACMVSAIGIAIAAAAPSIAIAYVGFALGGLGISVVGPLALAALGRSVPGKLRVTAISRATVIGYCAFFVGPSLMGFVSEGFGLAMSFYTIAALLAVVAVILIPTFAAKLRGQSLASKSD
jgi:MFS family permease